MRKKRVGISFVSRLVYYSRKSTIFGFNYWIVTYLRLFHVCVFWREDFDSYYSEMKFILQSKIIWIQQMIEEVIKLVKDFLAFITFYHFF